MNFYYRCSAVDTLTSVDSGDGIEIRLHQGIDETWIAPRLEEIRHVINAQRRVNGFGDIPSLNVVATV